jgi:GNAT superfamily N-acetyltransferase
MIRLIKEYEIDILIDLCEKHAEYEKAEYKRTESKKSALKEVLFSEFPNVYCLVAIDGNDILGYATYMLQYSTWDAENYIYLDCLFLKETARGKGLGQKLMNRVKAEAVNLGIDLIQWQTPDFNIDAIRFYNRLGAISKKKERFFWDLKS